MCCVNSFCIFFYLFLKNLTVSLPPSKSGKGPLEKRVFFVFFKMSIMKTLSILFIMHMLTSIAQPDAETHVTNQRVAIDITDDEEYGGTTPKLRSP